MKTFTTLSIKLLFALVFLSYQQTTNAQNQLKNALQNIAAIEAYETEKVYLQLDRTIFAQGEDIWFKAYLIEGTYHTLTSSSNNLHVELISSLGEIISSQVILMHEGVGYGDIPLPSKKCPNGTYKIRAYTNFMRNFDDDLYFSKKIIINNSTEILAKNEDKATLQFKSFLPDLHCRCWFQKPR